MANQVALLIHGVGNPAEGDVLDQVRRSHALPDMLVEEVCWNKVVQHPAPHGALLLPMLERLLVALGAASLIGRLHKPDAERATALRLLDRVSFAALVIGEVSVVAVLGFVVVLLPLSMLSHTVSVAIAASAVPHFNWSVDWLLLLGLTFFAALSAVLTIGLVSAVAERDPTEWWVALRKCATLCLRPALLIVLAVFLVPWGRFRKRYWGEVGTFALLASPLLLMLVFVGAASQTDLGLRHYPALLAIAALVAAPPLVAYLLAALVRHAIGIASKVLLDIFRYVAEPGYRDEILGYVEQAVARCRRACGPEGMELFIVAHSLGSVIALDLLVGRPIAWRGADRVTLVTLGSPIKRFFFRFFPGLLFPARAPDCGLAAAGRVGRFRWINIYRPGDEVGSSLGLVGEPWMHEQSTGQRWPLKIAHVGYWSDPVVYRLIGEAAARVPYRDGGTAASHASRVAPMVLPASGYRRNVLRGAQATALTLIVLAAFDGVSNGLTARKEEQRVRAELVQQVLKEGVDIIGEVTSVLRSVRCKSGIGMPTGQTPTTPAPCSSTPPIETISVQFVDSEGVQRRANHSLVAGSPSLFHSTPPFADFARLTPSLGMFERQEQDGPSEVVTLLIAQGQARIRYLPENSAVFVSADFPPPENVGYSFMDLAMAIFLMIAGPLAFYALVCHPSLRLAMGESAFRDASNGGTSS